MGVSGITSRVITSESQRERERRESEREMETEHAEPVSGFRSQAISSEWMRMPNMSHRAPTLNSEEETSRKSFSFWQSVIARALRSYLCATVSTVYSFTPTHTQWKKKPFCQRCHTCRWVYTNRDICSLYWVHTHRHVMSSCLHTWAAHTWMHNDRARLPVDLKMLDACFVLLNITLNVQL